MKAVIDAGTCIGCELCVSICPDVFEMKDNIAVTKVDQIPEKDKESAKQAAQDCPVNAITINE